MKTLILDGKSIFIYEDGSVRIYSNGTHFCFDEKDIKLIIKQIKNVQDFKKAIHKNIN